MNVQGHAEAQNVPAFLCFDDWAGYHEEPVRIVGETRTRYRIQTDKDVIRLAGRYRYLRRGETALVPKRAVRIPAKP